MRWNKKAVIATLKENSKDTATQFRTNFPGLVAWCDRNGGWDDWRKKYKIEKRGWTEKKVMVVLKRNKNKNYTWFLENYASLVLWCRAQGGWRKWADGIGIKPKRSYRKWNEERAEEIFKKHDDKPMQWFYDNLSSLIQWCNANGGIIYWKQRVNKTDIARKSKRIFDEKSVLKILKGYKKYTAEEIRGIDSSVVSWCEKNGTWEEWIDKSGIKHKDKWTEEKVVAVLIANKNRTYNWFHFNYSGITGWCSAHGGWRIWAEKCEVKTASKRRTPENVVIYFKENNKQELMWFIKNEPNLVRWCYRNHEPASEGLRYFAGQGGVDIDKVA